MIVLIPEHCLSFYFVQVHMQVKNAFHFSEIIEVSVTLNRVQTE